MTTTAAKTREQELRRARRDPHLRARAVDLVDIAGTQIGRLTLQPGWRWSEHVKPIAGTDLCQAPHFQYQVQGTLRIRMADGTEFEAYAGRRHRGPRGHDAWVVGDEPVVLVDWWGASNYAKG